MKEFLEGQATQVKKHKFQGRRRTRSKQPRSLKKAWEIRSPGPAQGFRLSYDPNDEHFSRKWVLSYKDLVLLVSRSKPQELWEVLTTEHKELRKGCFKPIPQAKQDLHRKWDEEDLKRINFWDRVWRTGKKKHSHPDVGDSYLVIIQGRKELARKELSR